MLEDFRLKVFMAVVRKGSFTLAAKELNVSQPAVSQHIAELEKATGAPLFIRTKGSAVLTSAGKVFCEYASVLLRDYSALGALFDTSSDGGRYRRISISADAFVQSAILPGLLSVILAAHPNLSFDAHSPAAVHLAETGFEAGSPVLASLGTGRQGAHSPAAVHPAETGFEAGSPASVIPGTGRQGAYTPAAVHIAETGFEAGSSALASLGTGRQGAYFPESGSSGVGEPDLTLWSGPHQSEPTLEEGRTIAGTVQAAAMCQDRRYSKAGSLRELPPAARLALWKPYSATLKVQKTLVAFEAESPQSVCGLSLASPDIIGIVPLPSVPPEAQLIRIPLPELLTDIHFRPSESFREDPLCALTENVLKDFLSGTDRSGASPGCSGQTG